MTDVAYVADVTVCSPSMVRAVREPSRLSYLRLCISTVRGTVSYDIFPEAGIDPRRLAKHVDARRVGLREET